VFSVGVEAGGDCWLGRSFTEDELRARHGCELVGDVAYMSQLGPKRRAVHLSFMKNPSLMHSNVAAAYPLRCSVNAV
jgi:hypothetical protein